MQYQKESSILCFGDTKQAALYWERVIPIGLLMRPVFEENLNINKHLPRSSLNFLEKQWGNYHDEFKIFGLAEILSGIDQNKLRNVTKIAFEHDLLINSIKHQFELKTTIDSVIDSIRNSMPSGNITYVGVDIEAYGVSKESHAALNQLAKDKLTSDALSLIKKVDDGEIKLWDTWDLACIIYSENISLIGNMESFRNAVESYSYKILGQTRLPVLFPSYNFSHSKPSNNDISLEVLNWPIIETDKATWDQIIEFRKDKEAKKKLRDLRLFLHTNYEGKSLNYIEDDIYRRLENYKNVCDDWGFETRNSVFSAIMDSQSLLATAAATLGAILLNQPIAQTISALAGVTLNIGKILLTYDKQKHAFQKLKRDHDLAYIIEAKERLESKH